MIRVYLQGRTGNQLFQFAFAQLLSKKLKTIPLFDLTDEPFRLDFFELPAYWSILNNKYTGKVYNRVQKFFLPKEETLDVRDCFQELPFHKFLDKKNYRGYFQDYRLFEHNKEELKRWFTVKKNFRRTFEEKYKPKLNCKRSIVLHFRLGDYNSFEPFFVNGKPPIVPLEWYHRVLNNFSGADYNVYCISDDIKTVMHQFQPKGFNVEYVQEDIATDFLLLNHADVCVISNSTFGWWGAFLNQKAEMIICPEYFLGLNLGQEYPPHIYPPNWVKISTALNQVSNG